MKRAKRNYWLASSAAVSDLSGMESLKEIKDILEGELKEYYQNQGYVAGGYHLSGSNSSTQSQGEFKIIDNKVVYFEDFKEVDKY